MPDVYPGSVTLSRTIFRYLIFFLNDGAGRRACQLSRARCPKHRQSGARSYRAGVRFAGPAFAAFGSGA